LSSLLPEQSLGYQVRIAHRALDRLPAGKLARYGLKSGYWYYLRVLGMEEGLTQKELGDRINVKENTTVAMILGMEKDGLVRREKHKTDGRKMCIYLTKKARALEKKLLPVVFEINDAATRNISKRDIDKCLAVLSRVQENLLNERP